MPLSIPQRGVAVGAASALAITFAAAIAAVALTPAGLMPDAPLAMARLLALCALGPASMLVLSVGRIANHRFRTPADIDGSGLTAGTEHVKMLQALLQNTLEQLCIALPVYAAWTVLAPSRLLVLLPVAASLFVAGRLLFFGGYRGGAPSRAFGFGLTFYPSVLMLVACICLAVGRLVA